MKISIIVPVYNVEEYVEKCIESLIKQTYTDIEIIIVDDGSTDNSGRICDDLGKKDKRIKVIHKVNGGLVSARKAALPYATGEYICNVDGDDWIDEDYILNYAEKISESNALLIRNVAFTKEFEYKSEVQRPSKISKDNINNAEVQLWIKDMLCGCYGFQNEIDYSNCLLCANKELYIKNQKLIDESIQRGEDLLLALYLLISTDSIDFIFNEGYHYVQRRESISNNTGGYSLSEYDRLKAAFRELIDKSGTYKDGIISIYYGYCAITYLNYFFGSHCEDKYLFPFGRVKQGAKIVVYGAGNIGKNIVGHLIDNRDYKLVGWINSIVPQKNEFGIAIKSVNEITEFDYDYIIIATNRKLYVNQMKEKLQRLGIEEKRIASIFDKDVILEDIV